MGHPVRFNLDGPVLGGEKQVDAPPLDAGWGKAEIRFRIDLQLKFFGGCSYVVLQPGEQGGGGYLLL